MAMPSGGEPRGSNASAVRRGEAAITVELLDEYWHSRNVLGGKAVGIPTRPPSGGSGDDAPSCLDAAEKEAVVARDSAREASAAESPVRRSLLRTPSLPPRVWGRERPIQEAACPNKSGAAAKLRHSYSNLEGVLLLSPGGGRQRLSPKAAHCGAARQRLPRDARVENIIRYVDGHHRAITGETRERALQVKKWRSLSDLETEEVQGFRDLGFVFDAEAVSPGVLEVVPGLRRPGAEGGGGGEEVAKKVRRPYLSEAWLVQRSAPPALDWVGGGSAADVKEQLRFWARVVACNVRQECRRWWPRPHLILVGPAQ